MPTLRTLQDQGHTLRHACSCSFLEIYSETVTDLLSASRAALPLREDLHQGVFVEGLSLHPVSCGASPFGWQGIALQRAVA